MTLKLLLVGRDKSDFQSIKEAFEEEDANLIVATSIGLAIFLARKNLPHLIISQYELTDSDALAFFYELKNEQELAKIPFVLLTKQRNDTEAATNDVSELFILQNNIPVMLINKDVSSTNRLALKERILAFRSKAI